MLYYYCLLDFTDQQVCLPVLGFRFYDFRGQQACKRCEPLILELNRILNNFLLSNVKSMVCFFEWKNDFSFFDQNICCPFLKSQKEVNVLILCWPLLCGTKTTQPFEYFINHRDKKKTQITRDKRKTEKCQKYRTEVILNFLYFLRWTLCVVINPFKSGFRVSRRQSLN